MNLSFLFSSFHINTGNLQTLIEQKGLLFCRVYFSSTQTFIAYVGSTRALFAHMDVFFARAKESFILVATC